MRMHQIIADAAKPRKPARFDITQTPEFKAWFAGSKVVDAQGKPLRVYHGTYDDFSEFSHEHAAYRGGLLAFFSASPEFASNYASTSSINGENSPGANVIPVYLRIIKPFDYREHLSVVDRFWRETGGLSDQHDIQKIRIGLGLQEYHEEGKHYRLGVVQFRKAIKAGSWDALEASEFIEWLQEQGCDGIITFENGQVNYGVFEPNQIKSAIGNRQFDPYSPNMTETRFIHRNVTAK